MSLERQNVVLCSSGLTTVHVSCQGTTAYVPQQAWIQNATLQDNILFGKDMEADKYNNIVEACALVSDLDMLPAKDLTEIGEKVIEISCSSDGTL